MIKKIEEKDLNKNQLMHLHFALGKAFEDVKKYENSFKNFNRANQYLSEIIKYDIVTMLKNL